MTFAEKTKEAQLKRVVKTLEEDDMRRFKHEQKIEKNLKA